MKLYTYWRSSAAYRVRIALNLKGIAYESVPVHLVKDGGEHLQDPYANVNPQKLIPALELDNGTVLTQSLAILEYLEEIYSKPALLPHLPEDRARVRALAQAIAVDIHPINNLRVGKHLSTAFGATDNQKAAWMRHWMAEGFRGFEALLTQDSTREAYCFGDTPTLADITLVPQVYNARRFQLDLTPFPTIQSIETTCLQLDAFANAAPENQGDAF